jgi:hypothetical protein
MSSPNAGRLSEEGMEIMEHEAEMRQEAAATLIALSNGFGSYTYNLPNSTNDEKRADNRDGVINEMDRRLEAKYVCDISSPLLHIDKCCQ